MTTFREGELLLTFDPALRVERFDTPGKQFPLGVFPVDFIVEREQDILLMEVKDPSNTRAPQREREHFLHKMSTKELTHNELDPKARTSWSYLMLMNRVNKPLRYVVVIGVDNLSVQAPLLLQLSERLKRRLAQEVERPWEKPYVVSCVILSALDVHKNVPGVRITRCLEGLC